MLFEDYKNQLLKESRECADWYIKKISSWSLSKSLTEKVSLNGNYLPFYGDTLVYPTEISPPLLTLLNECKQFSELFAHEIDESTFHVTLHDLSHGTTLSALQNEMVINQEKIEKIFRSLENLKTVSLTPISLLPCVNTALVINYIPKTEEDYAAIMDLFNLFDKVSPLGRIPRFHLTLRYFAAYEFSKNEWSQLSRLLLKLQEIPLNDLSIDLNTLCYQHFTSMNGYKTILDLKNQ